MKLFQRTLFSFALVIALQAVLSAVALSAIFGSMQDEDAQRELAVEAANAYESFNAWKLAFWKDANELAEDSQLSAALGMARGRASADPSIARLLGEKLARSAAEAVVIRDSGAARSSGARFLRAAAEEPALLDPAVLHYRKAHPYVDVVQAGEHAWFVGAARIGAAGKALDVFLLKRIDESLVSQLSYNPMVAVAAYIQGVGRAAIGRFELFADSASRGERAIASAADLLRAEGGRSPEVSYLRVPRRDGPEGGYIAVIQKAGSVDSAGGERAVTLAAVLSLAEYEARAAWIDGAVVAITLLAVAISIFVALVLSRSIASPIRRLSVAMRDIAEGDYGAEVPGGGTSELGELASGFNGMSRKLAADKLELEDYIGEIVGLKERGELIIESIREGLAVIDAEGTVESSNGAFRALFGEATTRPGSSLLAIGSGPFDQDVLVAAREALRDRERRTGITRRTADGRTFDLKLYPLIAAARPEGARCILVVEDISERLAYEERVIQADRLASIGVLSAGIAHEINNPLSSILANVGNAISETKDAEVSSSLRVVEGETLRIARIVRQLLDFSSPRRAAEPDGDGAPRCEVNEVVGELVLLVGPSARGADRAGLREELDPSCPAAAIPGDELKQVLLNLVKNAIHAAGRRGSVLIETRAEDGEVEIAVTDDGPGIPEELIGRIFDPFFTTRQARSDGEGPGIGLGLSVAYGIVTKRSGSIRAYSGEGSGARFVVRLPAAGVVREAT